MKNASRLLLILWLTSLLSCYQIHQIKQQPVILIRNTETNELVPLQMPSLKVDVEVVGNLATTTMEMTFFNYQNQALEGQFIFPLGEGQTVSRFAMTVNGVLREGVVVEKAKGRQVYEKIVRRRVDPGLLEWTQGNNFKARIYPILAHRTKTVVIAYEQELIDHKNGWFYHLPLHFTEKVDSVEIQTRVLKPAAKPQLTAQPVKNFNFTSSRCCWQAGNVVKNFKPNKPLDFLVPTSGKSESLFLQKNPADSLNYFYAILEPGVNVRPKRMPRKIGLLWDASTSGATRNLQKELNVLEKYFDTSDSLAIVLIPFALTPDSAETFQFADWRKLKSRLERMIYDGGTCLGALDLTHYDCDEFILASDGISNIGPSQIQIGDAPVITFNSNAVADHSMLKFIAATSGGIYLNLNELSESRAVAALKNEPFFFLKAEYDSSAVNEIYPSHPERIQNSFAFTGILKKDSAEVTLHFGFRNAPQITQKIKIQESGAVTGTQRIPRIWAQKKIADLDVYYKQNKAAIQKLGKKFQIVTRSTSLIVLDELRDYVQNEIVPPPDMQDAYFAELRWKRQYQSPSSVNSLDKVAENFESYQRWWKNHEQEIPFRSSSRFEAMNWKTERRFEISAPDVFTDMVVSNEPGFDDRLDAPVEAEVIAPVTAPSANSETGTPEFAGNEAVYQQTASESTEPIFNQILNYQQYLALKKQYPTTPALYLAAGDLFRQKNQPQLAVKILSNLAELDLADHELLRTLGYSLLSTGEAKLAISVFQKVLEIREEEPQSYRDLGLACAADHQYQAAVDWLYQVVSRSWDNRFPNVALVALQEMNAIIATCGEKLDLSAIDPRFIKSLPLDIRIVLDWFTDNTDVDLHIIGPDGEACFFENQQTRGGGLLTPDFIGGYGPEVFSLKSAETGTYTISVEFFGSRQQNAYAKETLCQVTLFTHFGRLNQQKRVVKVQFNDSLKASEVGKINFSGDNPQIKIVLKRKKRTTIGFKLGIIPESMLLPPGQTVDINEMPDIFELEDADSALVNFQFDSNRRNRRETIIGRSGNPSTVPLDTTRGTEIKTGRERPRRDGCPFNEQEIDKIIAWMEKNPTVFSQLVKKVMNYNPGDLTSRKKLILQGNKYELMLLFKVAKPRLDALVLDWENETYFTYLDVLSEHWFGRRGEFYRREKKGEIISFGSRLNFVNKRELECFEKLITGFYTAVIDPGTAP